MAIFHFDVVSPEKVLFSGEVNQVDVPGSEGDFGVLAAHTKVVTKLRPGVLVIHSERGALRIVVDGGFAEVGPSRLSVFADLAVAVDQKGRPKARHARPQTRSIEGAAGRAGALLTTRYRPLERHDQTSRLVATAAFQQCSGAATV